MYDQNYLRCTSRCVCIIIKVFLLSPFQIFECHFEAGTVKYTHSGSSMLERDRIKLRVYHLKRHETVEETFFLDVNVVNASFDIFVNDNRLQPLVVQEFYGVSNAIDSSVLRFRYNPRNNATCQVGFSQQSAHMPMLGDIVKGTHERVVKALKMECREFLFMGLMYKHKVPPTPPVDYLPLTVEVSDSVLGEEPIVERHYLPIEIRGAYPNMAPKASFMSTYIMDVDQFVLATIDPSILSASDPETPADQLVFNISQPLGDAEGCIVHLQDQTECLTSFYQGDLINNLISYRPPNISYPIRRVYNVGFTVFDTFNSPSQPIVLSIAVRPSNTNAPRFSVNTGLTLLEGQSRAITTRHLQIVDSDDGRDLRIIVKGGLKHGKMYVNNEPSIMFTPRDLEQGRVVYHHDDSDTTNDQIDLRVTDGSHTVRAKFPIKILPKDDTPPYVVNNVGLQLHEGATVTITEDLLSAHDMDSNDKMIMYVIKSPPKAGELIRKFRPMQIGHQATHFTEQDLQYGYIHYRHNGGEHFDDSFSFVLADHQEPPNYSNKYTVKIRINPVHDIPPQPAPSSTRSMTIKETDVTLITKNMLQYTDSESDDGKLVYSITTQPFFLGSQITLDAGRLISTHDMTMVMKNANSRALASFTQRQINHQKIAYMPPIEEIGTEPRHVRFIYTVSDPSGNRATRQNFDITILPVNDKPPRISARTLLVQEGGSVRILPSSLSAYDQDTKQADLTMKVDILPQRGRLMFNDTVMKIGDEFKVEDFMLQRCNIRYVHTPSIHTFKCIV